MIKQKAITPLYSIMLILLAASLASGCTSAASTPTITPTSSFTLTFTPSPTWTFTPTPTFTPTHTATPTPTPTPSSTPSPTPSPSPTLTPGQIPVNPTPTRPNPTPQSNTGGGSGAGAALRPTAIPHTPVPRVPDGANLLVNGGFEGGEHFQQGLPEIGVPDNWTAWWEVRPASHDPENDMGYVRPEMKIVNNQPPYNDPPRVFEGSRGAMFFGMYKAVDAGYWQQVTVTPGARLRLSGWGHAWSSGLDNPYQSEMTTEDHRINAAFRLGIDPTGGTSPNAPTVVWGAVDYLYDRFQQIPAVETAAQASVVTVFVHGSALWPVKHNDFYFDSIALEYLGQ